MFPFAAVALGALYRRRGIAWALVFGWLLLPSRVGVNFSGLPPFDEYVSIVVGTLGATCLFETRRLLAVRPSLIDIPMVVWCAVPIASAVTNGLGLYDGLSGAVQQGLIWGGPYLVGRVLFSTPVGMDTLARAIVLGAVFYVPLCLIEMRLSPQINVWVYGYRTNPFHTTNRLGGYRPQVFMTHGMVCGLFMMAAAVVAIWMTARKRFGLILGAPAWIVSGGLLVLSLLCRSIGAMGLGLVVGGALGLLVTTRWKIGFLAIVIAIPTYVGVRAFDLWYPQQLIDVVSHIDPNRARSLEGRLLPERELAERAMQKALFGWGIGGGYRTTDDWGDHATAVDPLWIIAFGRHGVVGLAALYGMLLVPVWCAVRRVSADDLLGVGAGVAAIAAVVLMSAMDTLANGFPSPVYLAGVGALAGIAAHVSRQRVSVVER